jgi:hypothetical protein
MMNMIQLLNDNNVAFITEGHKHCQEGWLQVECPFCVGNPGYHLGYNIQENWWNCWRCGWKSSVQILHTLLGISYFKARELLRTYGSGHLSQYFNDKKEKNTPSILEIPGNDLEKKHLDYLKRRKFNPPSIQKEWDIRGTDLVGKYKNRIIAPIYHNNKIVSFQGRDITDKSDMKYKACPKEKEIIHHKHTLYGIDKAKEKRRCVVVEGITDVWRLGAGAVATFGIKYTQRQVSLLSELFDIICILFDNERIAQEQAHKLGNFLITQEIQVFIASWKGMPCNDPGSMDEEDAHEFMKKIFA